MATEQEKQNFLDNDLPSMMRDYVGFFEKAIPFLEAYEEMQGLRRPEDAPETGTKFPMDDTYLSVDGVSVKGKQLYDAFEQVEALVNLLGAGHLETMQALVGALPTQEA